MIKTSTGPSEYQHHTEIHRDEINFKEFLLVPVPILTKTRTSGMGLSANKNCITDFSICRIDQSNFRYFGSLFSRLEDEAILSNHRLIFTGLDDISENVFGFNEVQQDIIALMYNIQDNTKSAIHSQIIKVTV